MGIQEKVGSKKRKKAIWKMHRFKNEFGTENKVGKRKKYKAKNKTRTSEKIKLLIK